MTPRGAAHTIQIDPRTADAYLSKAREFLAAAEQSLAAGNNIAATGNAAHAAIAAADAIAARSAGTIWRGEHSQAAAHLEAVAGRDGAQAAKQLRRVVPLKNQAEYDPLPIPRAKAQSAVTAAERIAAIAERVVHS